MAKFNQEDLIGEFITNVFISQIVLESSGDNIIETNPHIKTSPAARTDSKDNLTVTLYLILKEKLSDDLVGQWLNNIDFKKYLKVDVYQSLDARSTSLLSLSQDMLEIYTKNLSLDDFKIKLASEIFDDISPKDIRSKIAETITRKSIPITHSIGTESTIDDDGNEIHNITYKIVFKNREPFPEHLAYFVVSSFDVIQMSRDFKLELDTINLSKMNGKVVSDVVIESGDLVDYSYVFYDSDSKIWSGAVHQNENGHWRSKRSEDETSIDLFKDTVTNNKIQDFRNIKDIQRLEFDFLNINSKLGSVELKQTLFSLNTNIKENYLSDLLVTQDHNRDTKFFFSMDYEKIIKDNSLYGKIVKKPNSRLISDIANESKIKSMMVTRRRVTSDPTSKDKDNGLNPFDANEPDELIAVSGEKQHDSFVTSKINNGSLREIHLFIDPTETGTRHFSGMDKTMSDVTDGFYQYKVEFDIIDGSYKFFNDKIDNLASAYKNLLAYYNEASQLPMSKFLAEVQDPHIKHPKETAQINSNIKGNFDPISNRFTNSFANSMALKYAGLKLQSAPWVAPILVYADTLDIFTSAFESARDRSVVLASLFNFVSPKTGNPSGILNVLSLIESLQSTLSTISSNSNLKSAKRSDTIRLNPTFVGAERIDNTIKISKIFSAVVDSNEIKNIGLDYLTVHNEKSNDDGLRIIKDSDFRKRIDLETLKFFKDVKSDINIRIGDSSITSDDSISNTDFSFLSPSRIDLPRKSYFLIDGASSDTRTFKKSKVGEHIDSGKNKKHQNLSHILATITSQNLTKHPIASIHERFGNTKDPNDINQNAIEEIYDSLMSEHGSVTITPIDLETTKNSNNSIVVSEKVKDALQVNKSFAELPDPLEDRTSRTQMHIHERDNGGKNSFAHLLSRGLHRHGTTNKKYSDLSKPNITKSTQTFSKDASVDFKSLLHPKNLKVVTHDDKKVITGLLKPIRDIEIKDMPNHIKSIMLFNNGNGVVHHSNFNNIGAVTTKDKVDFSAEFTFNFEMLQQIEYLTGFEKNRSGNIMLNKPIWKILKRRDYEKIDHKFLLCRLIPYENSHIGLKHNKGLSVGSFDSFFLLETPVKKKIKDSDSDADKPLATDTRRIVDIIDTSVREALPNVNISVSLASKNITLSKSETEFSVVNSRPPLRGGKKEVKLGNINIAIPIELITQVVTQDCQNNVVPREHLSNNLITVDNIGSLIRNPEVLSSFLGMKRDIIKDSSSNKNKCSVFGTFDETDVFCRKSGKS